MTLFPQESVTTLDEFGTRPTIWAIRGLSTREIEHRAGWARESGQLDRYEHISDEDVNDQILETFGIETEDEKGSRVEPIENCPQCNVSVDTAINYCPNCGQKLSQTAWPDWFEDYEDEWGEDGLIAALKASPSKITENPTDLPEELLSHYQDRIETVVGESLNPEPVPEEVPMELPTDSGTTVHVSIPMNALTDESTGEPEIVRVTNDGYREILDEDENILYRDDPIGMQS